MPPPAFADLLTLITDRSAALRAAAAAAPDDTRVPSCPDWSVRDLLAHIGEVQRFWAAVVAAGPTDQPPGDEGAQPPAGELSGWAAESTELLVDTLRRVVPDHGCWTWWGASGAPQTAGAVARHQVQEAAVHAWDAQLAVGRPEPLPPVVARDGVAEFLAVGLGSCGPWPHEPAQVRVCTDDGDEWLLELDNAGASVRKLPPDASSRRAVDATVVGSASDLVLALYGRRPATEPHLDGDRGVIERLLAWPPLD